MVLKGTYGEKIHKTFRMARQGVRWRFQRLFSHVYVEAFETILMIEKTLGTQLREHAIRISKERYEARREAMKEGFQRADESAGDRWGYTSDYTFRSCVPPRSWASAVIEGCQRGDYGRVGGFENSGLACG
jgi:hypothetical protein